MSQEDKLLLGLGGMLTILILIGGYFLFVPQNPKTPENSPILSAGYKSNTATTTPQASSSPSTETAWASRASFDTPYPVSWTENWSGTASTQFSLTGISVGTTTISGPGVTKTGTIYATQLTFKANNIVRQSQCAPLYVRRVLNEEGDIGAPIESTWRPSQSLTACVSENQTYSGVNVTFEIDPSEKEFLFTTGGNSNVYFQVYLLPDGKISVEVPPTQGG